MGLGSLQRGWMWPLGALLEEPRYLGVGDYTHSPLLPLLPCPPSHLPGLVVVLVILLMQLLRNNTQVLSSRPYKK